MKDDRINELSHNIINYSCSLKPGENILIETYGSECDIMLKALIREAYAAGGNPYVWRRENTIFRELLKGLTMEQVEIMTENDAELMRKMDAYVVVRSVNNTAELSDVPEERKDMYFSYYNDKVHSNLRIPHTKWCVTRFPNNAVAQSAGMSMEAFEDYYFSVCNVDYARMETAMEPLKKLMERTDEVHIYGPYTDLSFSIKGMPAVKCAGWTNIPDGEIFTAPVKDSVNGVITFNTPSAFEGFRFENVRLEFRNGRIVEASANDSELLNSILDRDEGSRNLGEFSFGVNPFVTLPMDDILFDEKISGSIHFAIGNCYNNCDNGNHSGIHWDLILRQTPEFGGGKIYFDDVLIRKDGLFILPELASLNPDMLK